jgi:CRISPR/Cas system-associated endonuclease Cas1
MQLATELIDQKLAGQEQVARAKSKNAVAADSIAKSQLALESACGLDGVLSIEAKAALTYWLAWSELPIQYPRTDLVLVLL